MANELQWNIEGLDSVLAKMKQVEAVPRSKANRFALRKAANIVRDAAKAGAQRLDDPTTSESIADNIVVRYDGQYSRQTGDVKMSVGVLGGSTSKARNKSYPGGDTYYWRFLEFGTEKMQAKTFMRTALSENIEAATVEYAVQYNKALDRAIKRAGGV